MTERPVGWLRGLALSLERLAAQGVASGAVRGATEELRSGFPEDLDALARSVLRHTLIVLERGVGEAARSKEPPLAAWSRTAAEGAVRGAVEEARRLVPDMQPTTQELLRRLKLWLDRSEAEAAARAHAIQTPGDRARIAAAGAVAGASAQLTASLPTLGEPAAELAGQIGRSVVRGAAEEVGRQVRLASRSSAVRACAAGVAVLLVLRVGMRR